MTTKLFELIPEFVEFVPDDLEAGKIYVSEEYQTAIHLCACGCGNQVVTPTSGLISWEIEIVGDSVSLSPSIGNRFECRSHYFLKNNQVQWL